ncbi:MAG: hypothetical protein HHAS10_05990 [Candidatus Altimarinota bacterium]
MKHSFTLIYFALSLSLILLISACTKLPQDSSSNRESETKKPELLNPSQDANIKKDERKEFVFSEISVRDLYGGLGDSTGSIGGVTSFYISSGTSLPDFEVMEDNITEKFSDKKAYLQKFSDSEMLVCTMPSGGNCFNAKGTLVEQFIKNNNL